MLKTGYVCTSAYILFVAISVLSTWRFDVRTCAELSLHICTLKLTVSLIMFRHCETLTRKVISERERELRRIIIPVVYVLVKVRVL